MPFLKKVVIQIILGAIIGALCGLIIAFFLFCLERVTDIRVDNSSIVFALPLAGLAMGLVYDKWGELAIKGNNLVLSAIQDHSQPLPRRMAPMVFIATTISHLFGASVGREGAAVQIGAVVAQATSQVTKLGKDYRHILMMGGVAGGFAAAFGAPLAATIFALEVSHQRKNQLRALPAVLPAAFIGNYVTRLFIKHAHFSAPKIPFVSILLILKLLALSLVIGAFCIVFIEVIHCIKKHLAKHLKSHAVKMTLGGLATVLLYLAVGNGIYLGLGSTIIAKAVSSTNIAWNTFLLKLAFTSVVLGSGFVGGEVTPLFFMGATLGNVAGKALRLSPQFCGALGLCALFSAAANTPLALSVLAAELFGIEILPYAALVCFLGTIISSEKRGIYLTQRIFHHGRNDWLTLEELQQIRDDF